MVACGTPGELDGLYIHISAIKAVKEHGLSDTKNEVGGVLLGSVHQYQGAKYVRIEESLPARHADEKHASLTFTHQTWQDLNKEREKKRPDLRIVGWYHTHPGMGVFLSGRDKFIQESLFEEEGLIALVFDSISGELGAFTLREGKLAKLGGFQIYGGPSQKEEMEAMACFRPKPPIAVTAQSLETPPEPQRPITVKIAFSETCINIYYLLPGALKRLFGVTNAQHAPRLSVKTLVILLLLALVVWQQVTIRSFNNLRIGSQRAAQESLWSAKAGDFDSAARLHRASASATGGVGASDRDKLVDSLWQMTIAIERYDETVAWDRLKSSVSSAAQEIKDPAAKEVILEAWAKGCKARGYPKASEELSKLNTSARAGSRTRGE